MMGTKLDVPQAKMTVIIFHANMSTQQYVMTQDKCQPGRTDMAYEIWNTGIIITVLEIRAGLLGVLDK